MPSPAAGPGPDPDPDPGPDLDVFPAPPANRPPGGVLQILDLSGNQLTSLSGLATLPKGADISNMTVEQAVSAGCSKQQLWSMITREVISIT